MTSLNGVMHGTNDNDAESFIGGGPLTSPPINHSAPYTQLPLSSITEGNTLSTTSLPLSLQSHVTLDEWHEFAMRMQPMIHNVDTFHRTTTPSNSTFRVILGCTLLFVLLVPSGHYRLMMAVWYSTLLMCAVHSVWLRRARALQLGALQALCHEEERFFQQRGLIVTCDFNYPTAPVGFCLYFWPIPTNRVVPLSMDHDHGVPNVFLRIRVDGLDPSSCNWWRLSATPPVSSHSYLESFQTLPFSTPPASMAAWNRFWPRMMQQSRELRNMYRWVMPFMYAACLYVMYLGVETPDFVFTVSALLFNVLCLIILFYGFYRVSTIEVNRHDLVKAYANEFAAAGLWVEDRQVYEVNHSNGIAITAYHVNVYLLDHTFTRPGVV